MMKKIQIVGRQGIRKPDGKYYRNDEDLQALDGIVRSPVIEVMELNDIIKSELLEDFQRQYPQYDEFVVEILEP